MKFKKTFLIVLLSASLIANSCIRSYAFTLTSSIAAGAVISVLSSWGLTFVFNGQSFSDSVNYIADLLDEWGGLIDFSDLGISTDGALVVGATIYNGLRNFATWLVDKFSISQEGAVSLTSPERVSKLFSDVGLNLMTTPNLEGFTNSGTLFTFTSSAYGYTRGYALANGKYFTLIVQKGADSSYYPRAQCDYSNSSASTSSGFSVYGNGRAYNQSIFSNGFKLYVDLNSSASNPSVYSYFMHDGTLISHNIGSLAGLGYDAIHYGTDTAGGTAIDAQNISIPDTDIDESNAGLFTLTNISALIGSYARDISSVMDDVINRALTVNNYNTVVNTGSVAATLAAADAVESVEDIDIAVTDPLPPPSEDDMQLSLSSVFPFCLPFDLYNFFTCLAADPVTPSFDVTIAGIDLHADAHALDSYVPVFRKFILLGYVITLVVNTKKILRGDS